jgi:hypothetical protein
VQLPIAVEVEAEKIENLKPNPWTLVVRIGNPAPPRSPVLGEKTEALYESITVVPSGPMRRSDGSPMSDQSLVMITIPKDGEFTLGEKGIEKAALEKEIRDRMKNRAESERLLFIKGDEEISYGSVEDVAQAAHAAGARLIYLVTNGRPVRWEEQGMTFTSSGSWRVGGSDGNTFTLRGPFDAHLTVDVLAVKDKISPENTLQQEYERALPLQKAGLFAEVRYLELDGVKGLLERLAGKGNEQVTLEWMAYRKYKGNLQYIWLHLSSPRDSYKERQYELNGILYSIKITQS